MSTTTVTDQDDRHTSPDCPNCRQLEAALANALAGFGHAVRALEGRNDRVVTR